MSGGNNNFFRLNRPHRKLVYVYGSWQRFINNRRRSIGKLLDI